MILRIEPNYPAHQNTYFITAAVTDKTCSVITSGYYVKKKCIKQLQNLISICKVHASLMKRLAIFLNGV